MPLPLRGAFDEMVFFRRKLGPPVDCTDLGAVVKAFRGAAMSWADQPPVEALSGHTTEGRPSTRPHVAWIALPDVGHAYADGHLLGAAAVLPREMAAGDREAVLLALRRLGDRDLTLGREGVWRIARMSGTSPLGLLTESWTRASDRWATATPVLLDRYPKRLLSREAEEMIAKGCERVGLPRPAHVVVTRVSCLSGAPPTFAYTPRREDGKPPRPLVHTLLLFHERVTGPILLGRGRYQGFGLCRAVEDDEAEAVSP